MKTIKEQIVKQRKNTKRLLYILYILVIFFVVLIPVYTSITFGYEENETNQNINDDIQSEDDILPEDTVVNISEYPFLNNANYIMNINNQNESINILEYIKQDEINNLIKKIKELIYLKYPVFIADTFTNETTIKTFVFEEEKLVIKFNSYGYEEYTIDDVINIYYNEIDDYLNFEVKLTTDYKNENGFEYDESKKIVSLTFDDGPHSVYTEMILNSLKNNKAKATFFTLGLSIEENPDVLKKIHDSGNEIAMHGYSHTNFTRMSISNVNEEINKTNDLINNITGGNAKYVRPPYGSINTLVKTNVDYTFVNWSVDPFDWKHKDPNYLLEEVIKNTEDGDIILLHDIFESSAIAAEKILQELYLRGYQVVDITTLTKIKDINLKTNEVYRDFN